MLDGWRRNVHGTIQPHLYLFFCCLMVFKPTFLHQKDTRTGTHMNFSAIFVFHYCCPCTVVLTEAKSLYFSPDGTIVLIALSVLSLAMQDLLVHR